MGEQPFPVPAVPSVVLALGAALQHKLAWLERRFRTEIGQVYPSTLLRFRLITRAEQLAPEALHALCDPLLAHPLWLDLYERGLAPGGEHGPQLHLYIIIAEEDARGCRLLPMLYAGLDGLYAGQFTPRLCLFYVGADVARLPCPEPYGLAALGFILGPVKRYGYRTAGRQEPFETIRLALNALLASGALNELMPKVPGLALQALGASAIAVARPQMETWLRDTLVERLVQALLPAEPQPAESLQRRLETRALIGDLFGLERSAHWHDEPDTLWEKGLGRRIAGLLRGWAAEVLAGWGITMEETRRGHWLLAAQTEGDLHHHLQQALSRSNELQEDAQVALSQDIVRLVEGLRGHFAAREALLLQRWAELPQRLLGQGLQVLAVMADVVRATEAGLARAREVLQKQRVSPLWLCDGRQVVALAEILAAQMIPVRSATERAHLAFTPPGRIALRLLPLVVLLATAGADLYPGGVGLAVGLGAGLLLFVLAAVLQFRLRRRETSMGMRELSRLYEDAIAGLVLAEARQVVRHLQEVVNASAAQVRAVERELRVLNEETDRALKELALFPRDNTYLERQLSDAAHCAHIAASVSLEELLGWPSPLTTAVARVGGEGCAWQGAEPRLSQQSSLIPPSHPCGEGEAAVNPSRREGRACPEFVKGVSGDLHFCQSPLPSRGEGRVRGDTWREELSTAASVEQVDATTPAGLLAATLRGDLPAAAFATGLVEAVGHIVVQRGRGLIETRVEEMLVAGVDGPFSAEDTMAGLRQRALPLWVGNADEAPNAEQHLLVMSREAAMAFRGWLAAYAAELRLLPTLQRDRISYLRLRPLSLVKEASCTG